MKIMERLIMVIHRGAWEDLEKLEKKYEALERQWGFPPGRRYRAGASGHIMNSMITEREWESYTAREVAYEQALANPEWRGLAEESRNIIASIQAEFYHPIEWSAETSKYSDIRERLTAGKLTGDDIKVLDELALRAQEAATASTVAGRPIVARLPFGMDIIK
jgi:hypothetical protein